MNWNYIKQLSKNVLFDEFKTLDALVHRDEFKDTGTAGEQYTYRALWYYFQDNLFRNVYIRKKDGELTEIDLVAVSKKGIFVFESKNWDGHIYGDGRLAKWLVYYGKSKKYALSPIKQNNGHINALRYHFGEIVPPDKFFSIIIFSARCKLSLKNIDDNTVIVKRDKNYNSAIENVLRKIAQKNNDVLTVDEVAKLCRFFKKAQRPDDDIKQEHLRSLGVEPGNKKIAPH